jgi:hypothetical protein
MEIVNNKTTCDYVKAYDILHVNHTRINSYWNNLV